MYGDAAKNDGHIKFSPLDKFRNDHFGHIEKFKNDHIGHLCKHEIRSTVSSANSNDIKLLKYPSNFRQWPDPPPPPPRRGRLEKEICSLRRRPGSADPRFHRHISNLEKSVKSRSPQHSVEKPVKKILPTQDIMTIENKSKLRSANFCNFKIKNVNEWLESQVSFNPEETKSEYEKHLSEPKSSDSKCQHKNKMRLEESSESSCREITYMKDFANILQEKEDFANQDEYKETIKLTPTDVIHKYPDFSKNFYEMAESEASFVTELTAKVLNNPGDDSIENIDNIDNIVVKNTIPMIVQANLLDEIYEKNKNINPVITTADSQLSLRFSNTLSTNSFFFRPSKIGMLSHSMPIKIFLYLAVTIISILLINYVFMNFTNVMWYKLFGKPEETWFQKYILNTLKSPMQIFIRVLDSIVQVLSIPNKFNVEPYI